MIWEQINEDRKNVKITHYKNAFPEAINDINFTTLVEINQYKSAVSKIDEFKNGGSQIKDVNLDKRLQKYLLDFQKHYERHETETGFTACLFFSLNDGHPGLLLHHDYETVLLIQGYGEIAYLVTDAEMNNKKIYHCKTGDTLLLPRFTNHKPLIIGPRVTLSLGANPVNNITNGIYEKNWKNY